MASAGVVARVVAETANASPGASWGKTPTLRVEIIIDYGLTDTVLRAGNPAPTGSWMKRRCAWTKDPSLGDVLGPRHGTVVVDLIAPGCQPMPWDGVIQQEFFCDMARGL